MEPLNENAHALRPVRALIDKNEFRFYEAITFPDNPYQGCNLYLRRCDAFGCLKDDGTGLMVDVLDESGDIIQEYPISRKGFEYLRQKLKFKVQSR